jgi:hypothetical protein
MKLRYKVQDDYGDTITHGGGDVFATGDTTVARCSLHADECTRRDAVDTAPRFSASEA